MRNLLSAGFTRLWRNKPLWLSCALLASLIVNAIWNYYSAGIKYGAHSRIDTAFRYCVPFIPILISVVCALFIGVDYAHGTIRNKVVCGHSRGSVYLSNLILCSAASLIICTAVMVSGLGLGLPLLGGFAMGWSGAVLFFIGIYTLSLAWAALFTLLAMLINSRTVSAVAALLLSLALVMAGAYLEGRLEAQPTIQSYTITVSGGLELAEEQPNPAYLPDGPVRDVFQFLSDFTPGGQTVQHSKTANRPEVLMAYDATLFILSTAAGLFLFKRKDLK